MKFKNWFLVFFIFISNAIAFKINNSYVKLDFLLSFALFFFLVLANKNKIKFKYHSIFLLIFFFFFNGLFTSIVFNDNISGVLLNLFGILFFIFLFLNLLEFFSFDSLLKSYILAAKFCVFFGVVQISSFLFSILFNFDFLSSIYDPRWFLVSSPITYAGIFPKISSFFTEPAYLSCFLLPYLIISLNNFNFYGVLNLFFVFLVFVFTFSTIGFFSLFIYFISKFSSFKSFGSLSNYFFLGLVIFFVLINDSMIMRILQLGQTNLDSVNLSSLNYILNFNLIISSINWQYIIGYGLDSYQIIIGQVYESSEIFDSLSKIYEKSDLMLNGSPTLFFRFFVEFGILGYFLLFRYFNFKFLNSPFFFGFLAYCFRSGEYLRFDTLFFISMFIFFHSESYILKILKK